MARPRRNEIFIPRTYNRLILDAIEKRIVPVNMSQGEKAYLGRITKRTNGAILFSNVGQRPRRGLLTLVGDLQPIIKTSRGTWFKFKPPKIKLF